MDDIFDSLARYRVIPLVVIDDSAFASALGDALVEGGLPVAEVTFRTEAAEMTIRTLAGRGDIVVGAGTCLSCEQVDRAIDAGARFVVAPGTNPRVVEHALHRGIPIIPGVATATEIEGALALGVNLLKFFPAETLGGTRMLTALAAPYSEVRFMPSGGITPENLPSYLALHSVSACGGSWLTPRELIASQDFEGVKALVKQVATILRGPSELEL